MSISDLVLAPFIDAHIDAYMQENSPSLRDLRQIIVFPERLPPFYKTIQADLKARLHDEKQEIEAKLKKAATAEQGQADDLEREQDISERDEDLSLDIEYRTKLDGVLKELSRVERTLLIIKANPVPTEEAQRRARDRQIQTQSSRLRELQYEQGSLEEKLDSLRQKDALRYQRGLAREKRQRSPELEKQLMPKRYQELRQEIDKQFAALDETYQRLLLVTSKTIHTQLLNRLALDGYYSQLHNVVHKMQQYAELIVELSEAKKDLSEVVGQLKSKQAELKGLNEQFGNVKKRSLEIAQEKIDTSETIENLNQSNNKLFQVEKVLIVGSVVLGAVAGLMSAVASPALLTGSLIAFGVAAGALVISLLIHGINAIRRHMNESYLTELDKQLKNIESNEADLTASKIPEVEQAIFDYEQSIERQQQVVAGLEEKCQATLVGARAIKIMGDDLTSQIAGNQHQFFIEPPVSSGEPITQPGVGCTL